MVIGIFSDTYHPDVNGVATATKTLRDSLIAHGNDVYVVTTGLKGQKHFTFENKVLRIPGKSLKFLYNYRMSFIYNSKAYKILKKIPFDIIHVQQEFGISIFGRLCAKRFHVPLVYTYHTSYEDYSYYLSNGNKFSDKITKKAIQIIVKKIASKKATIITPSNKSRHLLRSYGVTNFINVVPNALSFSEFDKPRNLAREAQFKKEHHLEGKRILLYLGRIAKEKNIDELIKGFEGYKDKYDDDNTVFMLVGDGPENKEILKEIADSRYKDFFISIGSVPHDETVFYYQMADAFLCASTTETQGLTYSEAMASRTLVLAKYDFNLVGLIDDGVTGFFYDDEHTLADRIHMILTINSDEKKQIIDRGYQRNEEIFSVTSYYERIMHVYKKAQRTNF